jgi:HSP20 family molecular chaperone IbpA
MAFWDSLWKSHHAHTVFVPYVSHPHHSDSTTNEKSTANATESDASTSAENPSISPEAKTGEHCAYNFHPTLHTLTTYLPHPNLNFHLPYFSHPHLHLPHISYPHSCVPHIPHPHISTHPPHHNPSLTLTASTAQFYHHAPPWNVGTVDYPNAPDVDVLETEDGSAWVVVVDVPGVTDKSQLRIRWTGEDVMIISGYRPDEGALQVSTERAGLNGNKQDKKPGSPGTSARVDDKETADGNEKDEESENELVRVPSHSDDPEPSRPTCTCSCTACTAARASSKLNRDGNTTGNGKAEKKKEKKVKYLVTERRTGYWERRFSFPAIAEVDKEVKARVGDGVLRIWVRKGSKGQDGTERRDGAGKESRAKVHWLD